MRRGLHRPGRRRTRGFFGGRSRHGPFGI